MFFIKIVLTNKISQRLYQWGNTGKVWENQTQKLKIPLPIKNRIHEKLP